MNTASNEILDLEREEIRNKPTFARISFGLGLACGLFFIYVTYILVQTFFSKDRQGQQLVELFSSKYYLIISGIIGLSYIVSLISLIVSYVRKEKSVLKILASIGHGFILFSIVVGLIQEAFK